MDAVRAAFRGGSFIQQAVMRDGTAGSGTVPFYEQQRGPAYGQSISRRVPPGPV